MGSSKGEGKKMKKQEAVRHPAKFVKGFVEIARGVMEKEFVLVVDEKISADERDWIMSKEITVLDPFAGIGGIFALEKQTTGRNFLVMGIEIEEEWAKQDRRIINADSIKWMTKRIADMNYWMLQKRRYLYGYDHSFNAIVTSPCYGNRMADKLLLDGTRRNTYANALGRNLSEGNSGSLQWGNEYKNEYRNFHYKAWKLAVELLDIGGLFILNIKDHIRGGVQQPVSDWHRDVLVGLGMEFVDRVKILTPGLGQGQNRDVRVDHEWVITFRKVWQGDGWKIQQ